MRRFRWITYVVTLAALVSFVFWPTKAQMIERNTPFNTQLQESIEKQKPQIILLGNSMLGMGIDNDKFSEYTGLNSMKINYDGSASALWYLVIKNVICKASSKPDYLVVFIRDNDLTYPEYRVTGEYKLAMDQFATKNEDVLDRFAYLNGMSSFEYTMQRYSWLYKSKNTIRTNIESWVKAAIPSRTFKYNVKQVDSTISAVFANKNMDSKQVSNAQIAAETVKDKDLWAFGKRLDRSFLPSMIDMTKKAGIKLIFLRVKKARDVDPKAEPPEVKKYIEDLNKYLAENKIPMVDFTHDDRIKKTFYGEGDHMNPTVGMPFLTQFSAEALQQYFTK